LKSLCYDARSEKHQILYLELFMSTWKKKICLANCLTVFSVIPDHGRMAEKF